jgi:hypothetical protein
MPLGFDPKEYRFGRPALWTVLVVVLVLVLDLAGFDYDYENDDEEDALRVCRRFTPVPGRGIHGNFLTVLVLQVRGRPQAWTAGPQEEVDYEY